MVFRVAYIRAVKQIRLLFKLKSDYDCQPIFSSQHVLDRSTPLKRSYGTSLESYL